MGGGAFSGGEPNPWQKGIKYVACYKAAGAVKQNKAGSGAQPAEGRVTVLNREIRKGLAWKVDICAYHIKAAALRQEMEPSGDGGRGRAPAMGSLPVGPAQAGGPGGGLPSSRGPDFTQLGPLAIMVHQGGARRPVRTLL